MGKRIFIAAIVLATTTAFAAGNDLKSKKTTGVITHMESGDVACYLTLKDDNGKAFDELADFAICEQESLVGKRVRLQYSMENVMADECQGDPDCTKTRRVAIVTSVQVIASAQQASFCTATERVVFACRTGAKMVSICASKDASRNSGYLRYRFGRPDSRDPLELMLPAAGVPPSKSATGDTVMFSGGGGAWLRFRNGAFSYVVYTGIGKWGPHGEPREKDGVAVERDGKRIANLPCTGPLTTLLGDEWFARTAVGSNGEDFTFP